ncbi:MAG: hypothetical protein IH588_10945 [Anaerolineales bacterium]|nr:hypothetical protein [Anaerolineales bacterium]
MKKLLHPFLFFVSMLILVSLACSSLTGGSAPIKDTVIEDSPVPVIPTNPPPPTQKPADVPLPTATAVPPTVGPQKFFVEEFGTNSDQSNWVYYSLGSGSDSNLSIEPSDDGLLFDLGDENLYVYYIYDVLKYNDTKLTLVAENQGVNNNNVSLVCRFNADEGQWYEYSFESGGVWYLYAYDGGYNVIDNGGSNDLKQGKAVNEYGMTCKDNVITMYINGKMLKSYTDRNYNFGEGQIGFNISSLNVLPVIVNVQSFDIAEP